MPNFCCRIGVDFHVFDGKFQGSRSHLLGLYAELVDVCPQFKFIFFLESVQALASLPAFQKENVEIVFAKSSNSLIRLGWVLPNMCRRHALDILHTQYVMPFWSPCASAVTIHDVLFENFPQFFKPFFVFRSRLFMRWAARRADILLTVSDYSKSEISRQYGVPLNRIDVTHNAVDADLFYPGEDGLDVLSERGLASREFILTVGRIEPRKNHATLLKAYLRMPGKPPPLIIVGQRDFGFEEFESVMSSMPETHRVLVFSDISDSDLPALLRHALVFVYPSLAEGFGMPPLEALASGVPVITSSTTAIPEVVGDAAVTVNPDNELELYDALVKLCADQNWRESLVRKGLTQAQKFRWRESADVLASSYSRYLSRHR